MNPGHRPAWLSAMYREFSVNQDQWRANVIESA
jgi:hypothetical protein